MSEEQPQNSAPVPPEIPVSELEPKPDTTNTPSANNSFWRVLVKVVLIFAAIAFGLLLLALGLCFTMLARPH
jgi:hypothetical protein